MNANSWYSYDSILSIVFTMPRPPLWYLQKFEIFSDIDETELMELMTGMTDEEYACKYVLYTPHDDLRETYMLKEGEVTLYTSVDGKKVVVDVLKPGAIFGNIGFDKHEGHFAEVTQDSYVCRLPENFFLQMLTKRPDLAAKAFSVLSKKISQHQTQITLLSSLGARERVLATIKLLNDKDDDSILPAILRIPTKLTHEKLASMTGLTRETVTKQLQQLVDQGLVQSHKKHVRLTSAGWEVIRTIG